MKKIFGSKKDEIKGTREDCINEELYDLYSSPNINRVITSKIIRWAWHVARIGGEVHTGFWSAGLRERQH